MHTLVYHIRNFDVKFKLASMQSNSRKSIRGAKKLRSQNKQNTVDSDKTESQDNRGKFSFRQNLVSSGTPPVAIALHSLFRGP